jgi:hypothetical protein
MTIADKRDLPRGVRPSGRKYMATVGRGGFQHYLGTFSDAALASAAVQRFEAAHPLRAIPTLRERFDANWEPVPECGCWIWTGSHASNGYGRVLLCKGGVSAHRVSYELNVGPIPPGLRVLHKCDTRSCVNPDHLFLGTTQDNATDMARKDRGRRSKKGFPRHVSNDGNRFKVQMDFRRKRYRLNGFTTTEEAAVAAEALRRRLLFEGAAE